MGGTQSADSGPGGGVGGGGRQGLEDLGGAVEAARSATTPPYYAASRSAPTSTTTTPVRSSRNRHSNGHLSRPQHHTIHHPGQRPQPQQQQQGHPQTPHKVQPSPHTSQQTTPSPTPQLLHSGKQQQPKKIYSGSTVVYSKRRSLQEERQDSGHPPPPCAAQSPEDLFTKLQEQHKDPAAPRPPLVPETAWNTLRQVAPPQPEAETSFNERCSDEYGSIRFDTVRAFVLEDDADSGYHTGESTLCGGGGAPTTAPPPPGERTLSREDLKRRIEAFNDNQHGLLMTLRETTDTFQGFIRVYMNLMRPISMSLTARPPSIYDILTPDVSDPDEYESDTQLTSFYLPKDTTKVIHITSDTTAQEVIRALLQKFRITDNPRKFALYERLDEGHSKSTMRRLRDDECPLPLCLCWTAEGLNFHRFILQENDTGEIMWDAFSLPELDNFLRILDREEDEYVDQVKAKYQLMKIQMVQHMKHLDQQRIPSKDQRTPVFV